MVHLSYYHIKYVDVLLIILFLVVDLALLIRMKAELCKDSLQELVEKTVEMYICEQYPDINRDWIDFLLTNRLARKKIYVNDKLQSGKNM